MQLLRYVDIFNILFSFKVFMFEIMKIMILNDDDGDD